MTSSLSSSSSPFPPVLPRHCSNVPVLFELLRGEEEQCRVWLRAEMSHIPDPLIDSLFTRLIMSSSSLSAVPQSRSNVSELCELLEGEKVETRKLLRGEMDRLVNTLFERLTNKLRTNEDLDRSGDGGDRALVVDTVDRVESQHQPSCLIAQPSTSSLNLVAHQHHSNGDEMELNTAEMIEIKEEAEDGEETRIIDIADLAEDNQSGEDDGSRSAENAPMDWVKQEIKEEVEDGEETRIIDIADLAEDNQSGEDDGSRSVENASMDWVKQEIKEEFEDGEIMDIKEEVEDGDETRVIDVEDLAEDNEGGDGQSGEDAQIETTRQVDGYEIKGEFDYGQEIEIKQEDDYEDEATNNGEMMEIKKEEDEEDSEAQINEIDGLAEDNQGGDGRAQMVDLLDQVESPHPESHQPSTSFFNPNAHQQHSNANAKSGKRKSQTESTNKAVKRIKPGNGDENHQHKDDEEEEKAGSQEMVILDVDCTEPDCKTILNSREVWKAHLLLCHGKTAYKQLKDNVRLNPRGQTEHACTDCQAVYKSQHSLQQHWKRFHQTGKFQCSVCEFVANLENQVINHYRNHHAEKKQCTCNVLCTFDGCNKAFRTKHDLEKHVRDHRGEKPFSCVWDNCQVSYCRLEDAIRHVRTRHFHLPRTVKKQQELNIIDTRDPYVYVRRS